MTNPTHRTSQPRRGPVLSDNPLARGVIGFQTGDNIRGWTTSSLNAVANTAKGRSQSYNTGWMTRALPGTSYPNCTMAAMFRIAASPAEQSIFFTGGSGFAHVGFYLVGGLSPYVRAGSSQVYAGFDLVVDKWYTAVVQADVFGARLWLDGKEVAFVSGVAPTVNTFALGAFYQSNAPQNRFFKGEIPLGLMWGRTLSNAEIQEFFRNPWQIFRRAPRLPGKFTPATEITAYYPAIFDRHMVASEWFASAIQDQSLFDKRLPAIVVTTPLIASNVTQDGVSGSVVYTGQAGQGRQSNTGTSGSIVYTGRSGQGSVSNSGANGSILYTGQTGNGAVGFTQSGISGAVLITGQAGQGSITATGANGALAITGQTGNGVIGYTQSGVTASMLFTGSGGQGSIIALGANGVVTLTGQDGNGVIGFAQTGESGGLIFTGQTGNGVASGQDQSYGSGPFTYPHELRKRKREAEEELTEQVKKTIRRIAKGVVVGKKPEGLEKINDFASLSALRRSVEFYAAVDKSIAMRKAQDNFAAQEAVRLFIVEMERRAQQIEEDDIAFLMMQVVADIE